MQSLVHLFSTCAQTGHFYVTVGLLMNFTLCHWTVFISPQRSHWQKDNDQKCHWWDFSKINARNIDSYILCCWKSHCCLLKHHQLIFSDCHEKIFLKSNFLFVFCHWYYWKLQKSSFCHWSHRKIQKSTFCHWFSPKFHFTPDLNQIHPRVNIHPGCRTMH